MTTENNIQPTGIEKLKKLGERLVDLLTDAHPGFLTWNDSLREVICEIGTWAPRKDLCLVIRDYGYILKAAGIEKPVFLLRQEAKEILMKSAMTDHHFYKSNALEESHRPGKNPDKIGEIDGTVIIEVRNFI
jgi:hypothetical protein